MRGWRRGLAAGAVCLSAWTGAAQPAWDEVRSAHFIVYHAQSDARAREVSRAAEQTYVTLMKRLAFRKYTAFWTWDRRVRLLLYPSRSAFRRLTGAPVWARAWASHTRRTIALWEGDPDLVRNTLPHELAHLVLRDFIGADGSLPAWLNEGLAQVVEADGAGWARDTVQALAKRGRLLPVERLAVMEVRHAVARGEAPAFYAQAASLVDYLLETHGGERFRVFCGHLRDGKAADEALRLSYPGAVTDLHALESAWRAARLAPPAP